MLSSPCSFSGPRKACCPRRGTHVHHYVTCDARKQPSRAKNTESSVNKGSSPSTTTKKTWIQRFGESASLPKSTRDRGACPQLHTKFRTAPDAALLFVEDIIPRLSQATGFVILSSERARCLIVYEILKVFGKFSAGELLLEAISVEEAIEVDSEDVVDSGIRSKIALGVEEQFRDKSNWGGYVEFLIRDRTNDKILLVVEVKRHFDNED